MSSRKLPFENPWILWAAVLVLNAWVILPTGFSSLMFVDQAQSIYHARELDIGRVPHRDFVNHHFTGYLAGFWLIEHFIGITPTVFWVLAVIWNVTNAAIVYGYFSSLGDRRLATFMALIVSTTGWFPEFTGPSFNNQSYLQPLTYLYFACVFGGLEGRKPRLALLVASLVAGTMAAMDQRMAPYSIALLLLLFRRGAPSLAEIGWSAFCATLVPTLGGIYLLGTGAIGEFIRQTLLFPLVYRNPVAPTFTEWFELARFFAIRQIVPLTLGVIGIGLLVSRSSRPLTKLAALYFLFIGAWAVLAGARPYPHYGMWIAPIVVFGIGFAVHYSRGLLHRGILCVIITSSALVPLSPLIGCIWGLPFFQEGQSPSAIRLVSGYLREHYPDSRDILVWGYAPQIYNLSGTFSSFREVSLMSITGTNFYEVNSDAQVVDPSYVDEFKAYLRNSPPLAVVIFERMEPDAGHPPTNRELVGLSFPNMDFHRVKALEFFKVELDTHYELIKSFIGPRDRTLVYQRKPQPSSAISG